MFGVGLMLPIIHVDMNAFYASCHQAKDPSLKEKPILVAGDPKKRNGIILTASYEARKFGVKTAMPNWQAKKLCPEALFIKPDYELYVKTSCQVMEIIRRFSPIVEIFSIDEAWLDVSGCERLLGDSVSIAKQIQKAVARELDLCCSIGVSCNKLLAKMASDMEKPRGLTVISEEDVSQKLWHLPVRELFGVGRRMAEHLSEMNVKTIGDLAEIPVKLLEQAFGLNGRYLHLWANGIDDSPVDPHSMDDAKSMGHSTTLPKDVTSFEEAEKVLLSLSEQVGRRVRRENYMGRTITITLRDASFSTITRSVTISHTNSTEDIYSSAKKLLHANWNGRIPLRLLGVSLSKLAKDFNQLSIFDTDEKKKKLNCVMDEIKDRFGDGAIFRANLLKDEELNERQLGKTRNNAPTLRGI